MCIDNYNPLYICKSSVFIYYSMFLCCIVTPLSKVRERVECPKKQWRIRGMRIEGVHPFNGKHYFWGIKLSKTFSSRYALPILLLIRNYAPFKNPASAPDKHALPPSEPVLSHASLIQC